MALSSKEYWAQREAEQLKHNITEEAAYNAEVARIYADMLDGVQTQIDSFYGRYAAKEGISLAEAKKRVSKLDIEEYERKAKRYVRDKDFSPTANEEMRLYNATMKINRLEMLKANIGLELIAGHDELEKFMRGVLQGRTAAELARQAGILGKTITNNAQAVHAIVNGSFHSGTFSDRIWQYQDLMRADLSRMLATGLIQGKNPRAIMKDLKKYWYGADPLTGGGARYCMERLMRTELARVQTEAQKQSFERNGFDEYMFIVNGDCCKVCEALRNKVFKVSKMMPGENAPPMHPHCRCSTAAHSDRKEYEEWLDFLANGGTTEEYNAMKAGKQPAKGEQLKIHTPGSTQSFKRSLADISVGRAGLDKRRTNIINKLKKSGDFQRFAREEITNRDIAYLSAAAGVEFALFRSKTQDVLIRGNKRSCNIVGELKEEIIKKHYEWIAHSHVDGGILTPSQEDRETLKLLGQKTSIIIGIDGEEVTFSQSPFDF